MKLKWEVRQRLEEIEQSLFWSGRLSRSNLVDKFGISVQQASSDISTYQSLSPDSMAYNRSLRMYQPVAGFKPIFIKPLIKSYIEWVSHKGSGIEHMTMPLRDVETPLLRIIVNALHQGMSIEIKYQSLTSTTPTTRRITPHTVVFDNHRYHVRAFCHSKDAFRDFVLGRISKADSIAEPGKTKELDEAWNTLLPVRIGAHHGLTPSQKEIIQKDYGMEKGELVLKVRQAMLFYTLAHLRLDGFISKRTPEEQQIVLLNPDVLKLAQ